MTSHKKVRSLYPEVWSLIGLFTWQWKPISPFILSNGNPETCFKICHFPCAKSCLQQRDYSYHDGVSKEHPVICQRNHPSHVCKCICPSAYIYIYKVYIYIYIIVWVHISSYFMILLLLSDVQSLPNKRIKQAFIMSHLFFIAVQCISSYFPLFCSHAISQQFTCDQNQPTAELRPFWSKRFDQCLDPDGIASADDHHLTKNHQEQTMAKLRKLSFTEKWREYLEVYRALRVKRFLGDPGHCSFHFNFCWPMYVLLFNLASSVRILISKLLL